MIKTNEEFENRATKLKKYIWERCEADDQRTSDILGEIKQLFLDLIGEMENPPMYADPITFDSCQIRNEFRTELRKIITGGNNEK